MPRILLATLNAKYIHASFGLRYLFANLGDLQPDAEIFESDINQRPLDIAEAILAKNPEVLGLGVYIWNATESRELVQILKRVRPSLTIILGGPEVSYETADQPIVHASDYVITGEADLKFADLCRAILRGEPPAQKIHPADLPDLAQLALPYQFYNDRDVANRVIYVEASRGCPFTCEFCLSSLEIPVRQFPIEPFLAEMQRLLDRGVQHFKFVDRTFNLNLNTSRAILEFFLARLRPGLFLHFEMIPDRLPHELREIIARFPPGTLQFEVGIQTFNDEVSNRIKRRQNLARLADNFQYLRRETGVHIHADLIGGLPGETLESFATGFDRLITLGPQEIQVGILKRLRGTPIVRHDHEFLMRYNADPPYEILQNSALDFQTLQRLRRFARFWDLIGNSGNFVETTPLIWSGGNSPFWSFWKLTDFLYTTLHRTHEIALPQLMQLIMQWLVENRGLAPGSIAQILLADWTRAGRTDVPELLRPYCKDAAALHPVDRSGLKRQRRRLTPA
ncbi:MAG TPA: DUF4080 domain-containing protein [Verrucomicrobiae bacterium]|nr:DUF4080 domain-containing protein [Verrucomicrobiae bacterium]